MGVGDRPAPPRPSPPSVGGASPVPAVLAGLAPSLPNQARQRPSLMRSEAQP